MVDPHDPRDDESRPASPELEPETDPRVEHPELEEEGATEDEGAPE